MSLRKYIEENHEWEMDDIAEGTGKPFEELDDSEVERQWISWHQATTEAFEEASEEDGDDDDDEDY
jgi:hypothetical protein